MGLPNSGKTTFSELFTNVIHFDDFRSETADEEFNKCNLEALKFDNPVVEGVYNSVKRRKELLEICKDKDPKICIWIDTSPEICMSRPHNLRIN